MAFVPTREVFPSNILVNCLAPAPIIMFTARHAVSKAKKQHPVKLEMMYNDLKVTTLLKVCGNAVKSTYSLLADDKSNATS